MAKRWGASKWGTRTWGGYRIYKPNLTDFAISPDAPEATITRIKTIPPPGRLMSDVAVTMADTMTRHVVFAPVREAPVPAVLARTFIDLTWRMLDDMPPYEADEAMIQLYVDTVARELQRIYDAGQVMRNQFWPQNADEDYKALAMWEGILGLPVEPNGIRPAARRAIVMAKLRARHVSSGKRWVELLTAALGSEVWSYQEGPEDYTIRISIPFKEGSWRAGQVKRAARDITPAHLVIDVDYTDGFILGSVNGPDADGSLLSQDRL